MFYNPSLRHKENEYYVDPDRSFVTMFVDAFWDLLTICFAESALKPWIRLWLCFLCTGCLSPLAFLPHPYAITNLVAMAVILAGNGKEVARVRGVNKNMGWPHIVGWLPVMVVNILCLTTDSIGSEGKISWDNAGDDNYEKARFVALVYNTVTLGISILFDTMDTHMYYAQGKTIIERSKWTTDQLPRGERQEASKTGPSPEHTMTV